MGCRVSARGGALIGPEPVGPSDERMASWEVEDVCVATHAGQPNPKKSENTGTSQKERKIERI